MRPSYFQLCPQFCRRFKNRKVKAMVLSSCAFHIRAHARQKSLLYTCRLASHVVVLYSADVELYKFILVVKISVPKRKSCSKSKCLRKCNLLNHTTMWTHKNWEFLQPTLTPLIILVWTVGENVWYMFTPKCYLFFSRLFNGMSGFTALNNKIKMLLTASKVYLSS